LQHTFELTAGGLHRYFEKNAPKLASEAVLKACDLVALKPSTIDALLICTCTGYLCPGLSSYVSEILGLRPNAFLQDLLGLGCGAALPLLETARGILAENPQATIATVAVEISSAAFYLDDEPGVLISLCLFGDGAAAAIWKGENQGGQFRFQVLKWAAYRIRARAENLHPSPWPPHRHARLVLADLRNGGADQSVAGSRETRHALSIGIVGRSV
jgi:alkylresorcinol/alkylpyrone synthase